MSAIASTAVTVLRSWDVGDRQGKQQAVAIDMSIVLSSQGGTSGDIPAATLGFTTILRAYTIDFVDGSAANRFVPVIVPVLGDQIYPIDLTNGTDADRNLPANVTGTLYVHVEGFPTV